ncbi:GNAT family protein [Hymenobacter koreensis]|uniref:GNAT family protein n=1 Tax=Hymenobacter koreensis TaxID=1084523 RepID=A0ABP8JHS3_9BACT
MLHIQLTPFPSLHTPRLTLRQLQPSDAEAILFSRSNEDMMRYIPREKDHSLDQAHRHLALLSDLQARNEGITWGLSQPPSVELLGTICLWNLQPAHHRAEIGYGLHPDHWGQGLMSEAVAAVLRFGFEDLQLHTIEAKLDPANTASIKLLERHGFVREGYFREDYRFQDRFLDTAVYTCHASSGS